MEAWEKMGLVERTPEPQGNSYRVALATRMGQVISAKCPSCGEIAQAPKAMFLEPTPCPHCNSAESFVFLVAEVAGLAG